jgi:1-acyl-sn-glycerol-3-phosphate acyltransferase
MAPFHMFRGWLALTFVSLALAAADLVQRLVVAPWVKLRPSDRTPVLGGWIKIMAWLVTRPVGFFGGCVVPNPPRLVRTGPGVLVVMNHQSLFDIPNMVKTVEAPGYPRIVTRERYARWIPLISHMVRLYDFPTVDPGAGAEVIRRSLDAVAEAARTSEVPLGVFPEGTRTKDGEIGRFKRGALSHILAVRTWTVYVYVTDGFWKSAKYKDFIHNVSRVRGKVEHVGTLEWTDPSANPDPFIAQIREMMVERLQAMRASSSAPRSAARSGDAQADGEAARA